MIRSNQMPQSQEQHFPFDCFVWIHFFIRSEILLLFKDYKYRESQTASHVLYLWIFSTFLEYIWLYLYLCLMFCVGMSCIYGKQRQYLLEACPWCVFVLLVLCECFYCVCECVDVGCPCLNYNYNHYHSHHMLSH